MMKDKKNPGNKSAKTEKPTTADTGKPNKPTKGNIIIITYI